MQEIELKILNIDTEDVEERLLKSGAKKIGTYSVKDEFYDFPDKEIQTKGEVLRLRLIGDKAYLTYKGCRQRDVRFKVRQEEETEIKDPDAMKEIFNLCGLRLAKANIKKRISYMRDNVSIEVDCYPGVPPYLEIESTDKHAIQKMVEDIGFTMEQTTAKSIRQVLADYGLDKDK